MYKVLNFEINDNHINILEKAISRNIHSICKTIPLEEGIVENYMIVDPDKLKKIIKSELKLMKAKTRDVHITLSDKLVNIRRIEIDKEISNVKKHIEENHLDTVSIIVSNPVFDHIELEQKEKTKTIIFYAVSNDVLVNYYSFFKKMKLKIKSTEIFHNAMYNPYRLSKKDYDVNNTLIINVETDKIKACVYENAIPIFSVHEEVDMKEKKYRVENLEELINKITRYYKFNISQGMKEIERMFMYNNIKMTNSEINKLRETVGYVELFKGDKVLGNYHSAVNTEQLINLFSSLEGN